MRLFVFALAGTFTVLAPVDWDAGGGGDGTIQGNAEVADRPFLAIWQHASGNRPGTHAPYLRAAFWEDGRVLFSLDKSGWGHNIQEGRISKYRVDRLKESLSDTGLFELAGNCYLFPDAEVDCVMADLGSKKQMLYWSEGLSIGMKRPHQQEFVKSWTFVNDLASVACPDRFEPVKERFRGAPESWYLKPQKQSE